MFSGLLKMLFAYSVLAALSGCAPKSATAVNPVALIQAGWTAYRLGDYDLAASSFTTAYELSDETSEDRAAAAYALGTVWCLRRPGENLELARNYFAEVINDGRDDEYDAWSDLALVRIDHLVSPGEEPPYDLLLEAYRKVKKAYPNHSAAQEAALYEASILAAKMNANDAESALVVMQDFLARYPDSIYLSAAYAVQASCFEQLARSEERLEAEEKALAYLPREASNPFYDLSSKYWKLAVIAEFEAGNFDVARKYYTLIIEEYPQDIRVFGCKQALLRMDTLEEKLMKEINGEATP